MKTNSKVKVIIISPSLDIQQNVSGISAVTKFIINSNQEIEYKHFEIGKKDDEKRNILWFLRIIHTYIKWVKLISQRKFPIVHFNMAVDKKALIRDTPLLLIAKLFNKRIIIHMHGGKFSMNSSIPLWMKYLLKLIFHVSNYKIVLSYPEKDFIRKTFNCKNLHVLPNCIELSDAYKFNRTHSGPSIPILLFMGRISTNKGIEYIFKALEFLKQEGHAFRFLMAGKGPEEEIYIKKFNDLLGNDFTFHGTVSGNQKTELLKYCTVFLLPSYFEGLPMALLESMSFGLVPITTNVGSIKNLITNGVNGIIVSKQSSQDIINAIKKISKDLKFAESLSSNARQYIFSNYDPDKYISQLNKIYDDE